MNSTAIKESETIVFKKIGITESVKEREEHHTASLCGGCLHEENCINRGTALKPVLECNEFECGRPQTMDSAESLPKITSVREITSYKGLCATCENNETCMYADMVTGVWNCEEYK